MDVDASILLLGDRQFQAQLLFWLKDMHPYHVSTALTANEARALITNRAPDVLLSQMGQPAYERLCRDLKNSHSTLWMQCLMIDIVPPPSTPAPNEDRLAAVAGKLRSLAVGANDYLSLSLVPSDLQQQQLMLLATQLERSASQARNLCELLRANDLLSAIALSDPLTELQNRRALEWELPRQVQLAKTQQFALSLIMLDIDSFKAVNDTYGHLVGDRVIQLLADRLRQSMRFYDTPFRYGGEEFVLILSSATAKEAAIVAERVRHLIGDQPFIINDDLSLPITISLGVATLHPQMDDDRGRSLLKRADDRLLTAKRQGRDRVVASPESPPPDPIPPAAP